jgi:uncharacterized membrane protein
MRDILLVLSVFLASLVEGVEALTIVLAMGTTRGWRSTWYGVLGPGLKLIPLNALRIIVGGLLLTFGLQWLRKAILRASGFKPLHDETAIFKQTTAEARTVKTVGHKGIIDDWYAFTIAFKGVLLEGLEVAFIVVTFGASQGSIPLAIIGAAVAIVIVVIAGLVLHRPLAQVPENTLKFVVGIMLTSFGTFWGAEGAGVHWPGSDAALLGVIALVASSALMQVVWLRGRHDRLPPTETRAA